MTARPDRFLRIWTLTCAVLALILAAFNALMDPYLVLGTRRIESLNSRKPAVYSRERLIKTYDVLRETPSTLILGASRVDFALNAQHPAWPVNDRPVYNLGVRGASPYMSYRYLQYVLAHQRLTLVVLALDFEYFLVDAEPRLPTAPDFEIRLAVARNIESEPVLRWRFVQDVIETTMSLDALHDSAATLVANLRGASWDVSSGNVIRHDANSLALGSDVLFASTDLYAIRQYGGKRKDSRALADVRAILNLCEAHGVRAILFIDPTHVNMLEIYDLLGYWPLFEDWKRDLLAQTAAYGHTDSGDRVPLWDFTGYDDYSTESARIGPQQRRWYRESFHYTKAVGDEVIRRIFAKTDAQFGVVLSPKNMESHLLAIREQQRLYREHNQADVRRLREIYETATRSP